MTEAQRLALTGGSLFEGLYVHTTDIHRLWGYWNSAWVLVSGTCRWQGLYTNVIAASATVSLTNYTEQFDTDLIYPGSGPTFTIPASLGGTWTTTATLGPASLPNNVGELRLVINGSPLIGFPIPVTPSGSCFATLTAVLAPADTISLVVFNGHSAGSLSYSGRLYINRTGP